jgi:hypothetical protein
MNGMILLLAILAAPASVNPQPEALPKPKNEIREGGVVYFDAPIYSVPTYRR